MRKIVLIISIILFCYKGEAAVRERDSAQVEIVADSMELIKKVLRKPHSPHKATIMAMILPGSGQIYNRQWWKVPILYGGIAADIYGITWNQRHFKDYRDAYVQWVRYLEEKAINPDTPYPENPAWDKIPKGFDVQTDPFLQTKAGQDWFKNTLNNRKTSFKRNRDLCYIVMAAIYAINIIDAAVYAHFYNFEIDDDLSLHIQPTTTYTAMGGGFVGLTLSLNF